MAVDNDILGISGQLDISDIVNSINKLYASFGRIENMSNEMSAEVEKAFKAVGQATEKEVGEKAKQALGVFKRAFAEAKDGAELNVTKIEASIERLQNRLAKISVERTDTIIGSKTYDALTQKMNSLNTQIQNQQQALAIARHEAATAGDAYNTFLSQCATASSAVDVFTTSNVSANTALGVNAGLHATAGVAIAGEGAARVDNAKKIEDENDKLAEQKKAVEGVIDTLSMPIAQETPISATITTIQESLDNLRKKNQELQDAFNAPGVDNEKASEIDAQINQNIETISGLENELIKLKDIASQGYSSVEEYQKKMADASSAVTITPSEEYLEGLKQIRQQAQDYFETLPTILERVGGLLKSITPTPENEAFIQQMQNLLNTLGQVENADAFLSAQRESLSQKADALERLSEGEMRLQRMYETQQKNTSEANKTAKATGQIGKEAEKSNTILGRMKSAFADMEKSAKSALSQLKSGFSGGQGLSGVFKLLTSGKFIGWASAIGAVAGAVKGLSDAAESLRKALVPLKPYLNNDVFNQLRESFINTASEGSAQTMEDMAAAATRWVKYYKGIRDAPDAIQAVVDASRELATITGTSADKAAETLTKLAGQFHLTAEEATKSTAILINATRNSTVKYDELAQALVASGARANMNGATLKEYAAAISLASAQYGGASQAASAYQRILQKLSTETNDNYNPKVVGATKAFQNLREAMESGENMSKRFGKLLWSQAQYFIMNSDEIANYTENLDDATGKQNALTEAEKTAAHHKAELQNSVSALATAIDLNLTPAFTDVVDWLTEIVRWCGKAAQSVQGFFDDMKETLGERWYDMLFKDFNALWNPNYKDAWRTTWTERGARKEYRKMLEQNDGIMGEDMKPTGNKLLEWYDSSKPTGLTREEIQNIILEENRKWLSNHKTLSDATPNGGKGVGDDDDSESEAEKKRRLQEAERQAKLDEDFAKRRRKYQQEQAEQRLSAEYAAEEAIIAAMADGSEKEQHQMELDHKKRLDEIERQRLQMLEKNAEYAAAEYDKKRKKGQKGYYTQGLDKNVTLTEDQQSEIDSRLKIEVLQYKKKQEDSADELIKQHQSYIDRKKEIDRDYQNSVTAINKAIAEAEARGDNERAESLHRSNIEAAKQRAEQLSELALSELKKTPEYVRAFEDLGNTSSETLSFLIKEFERAKKAAAESLDIEHLREYTSTLQQMYDEINSRNPFKAFAEFARELKEAQDEVHRAERDLSLAQTGIPVIKKVYADKDGKIKVDNYSQEELQEKLAAAKDKEAQASNRLLKSIAACAQQIQYLGSTLEDLGNKIGGAFGDTLGAAGGIASSLGNAISSLQNINTSAKGFSAVLQKVSAVSMAISAMIDMNMKLDSLLPDSQSLYEHYAAKQREINKMQQDIIEMQIAQLEDRQNKEHWIYSNGMTNLQKGAELNAEYLAAYGKIASQPQEIYKDAGSGFSKWAPAIFGAILGIIAGAITFGAGAGIGATLGATIGSAIGGTAIGAALGATVIAAIGTAIFSGVGAALANAVRAGIDGITYDSGQTAAVDNMRVQTRHKTLFRSEKTQDLESWVRDNWGEELFEEVHGVKLVDPEVARKILEDGPTLVGETRETLEKLTEYSEKIHEFLDDVHEQVSEAFSPLVDNLTDALWDWLADGEDVMDKFREYANDTFKDIAQDAIKTMANRLIFEPFQEQLEDLTIAYGTGQIDETAYMLGVAAFAKEAQEAITKNLPTLQNALETIQLAMENAGLDVTAGAKADDQSATYNSLEKWTYEQADDLINRATALQIIDEHQYQIMSQGLEVAYSTLQSVDNIRINVGEIVAAVQATIELQASANSKLDRIITNTTPISEIRDYVKKLYNER